MKLNTGIYKIEHISTGKMYIGSAVNIRNRWNQHKSELRKNVHNNAKLQNAWNKYGEESFEFKVLEYCEKEELLKQEQQALDTNNCVKEGFNICLTAGSQLGLKRSDEIKKAQSEARRGRKLTEEHRRKISEGQTGIKRGPLSQEHKDKISLIHTGRKRPERSKEWREKMSKSKTGSKASEEARKNMSESQKGKTHSEETKLKMSQSALGRVRTEESKRKQSESRLKNSE